LGISSGHEIPPTLLARTFCFARPSLLFIWVSVPCLTMLGACPYSSNTLFFCLSAPLIELNDLPLTFGLENPLSFFLFPRRHGATTVKPFLVSTFSFYDYDRSPHARKQIYPSQPEVSTSERCRNLPETFSGIGFGAACNVLFFHISTSTQGRGIFIPQFLNLVRASFLSVPRYSTAKVSIPAVDRTFSFFVSLDSSILSFDLVHLADLFVSDAPLVPLR